MPIGPQIILNMNMVSPNQMMKFKTFSFSKQHLPAWMKNKCNNCYLLYNLDLPIWTNPYPPNPMGKIHSPLGLHSSTQKKHQQCLHPPCCCLTTWNNHNRNCTPQNLGRHTMVIASILIFLVIALIALEILMMIVNTILKVIMVVSIIFPVAAMIMGTMEVHL